MLRQVQVTSPVVAYTDRTVLSAAKRHLDDENQDCNNRDIIDKLNAAIVIVEGRTGLTVLETSLKEYHACFPAGGYPITLGRQPVRDVGGAGNMLDEDVTAATIDYVDTDEASQQLVSFSISTSEDFNLVLGSNPPEVRPYDSGDWPAMSSKRDSELTITYKAGYGRSLTDAPMLLQNTCYAVCRFLFDQEQGRAGEIEDLFGVQCVGDEFTAYQA